ncbi:MAG: phage head morphogenesis protein [Shimia sp.]
MADYPDRPGYSFQPGPPPEVSRFFRTKGVRSTFSWQDVEPEEHAVAFTVAKAMQADVLSAIREELQRAIDGGVPYQQFARELQPRLERLGWWGRRKMVDPATGEAGAAQLGSPRRLRTIYQANLRSARAAGQWERIQRTKRAMPYLLYQLGPSERHRPHHAAKEGTILPADDPFWEKWFPPSDWGCKCWVRQITQREADRRGGVSERPPMETRERVNTRTGAVRDVPVGIDPGWDVNPGVARQERAQGFLADRIQRMPREARADFGADILGSWFTRRLADRVRDAPIDRPEDGLIDLPIMRPPPVVEVGMGWSTPIHLSDVGLSRMWARHPDAVEADFSWVARAIDRGTARRLDDRTVIFEDRGDADGPSTVGLVTVAPDRDGMLQITEFRRTTPRDAAGILDDLEVLAAPGG